MPPLVQVAEARAIGEQITTQGMERLRTRMQLQVRRSMGITGDPAPVCTDPTAAYFAPDSITRRIHGDLPAMLIGGLSALLFQMLHPLAMAGVAQHSNYREDPLGRLERTAFFLGTTTFGTRGQAQAAIDRVRSVHRSVTGTAPDGRPYSAEDPVLLTWVHCAELRSFLNATLAYGPRAVSPDDQDRYVDEMARVAIALGAVDVPRSVEELDALLHWFRPQLRLTAEARTARNFVLRGVGRWPHEVTTYSLLVGAATGIMPAWTRRQLRLPSLPVGDRLAVRPTVRTLSMALRWVVGPPPPDRLPAS